MENLIKHTARLVALHNCVIIPGVGAFLAHDVSAYYDADNAAFMPPMRTLAFNPQVIVDDALLVSEYIDALQLTYNDASRMMRNDILSLRRELSTKGTARFGELGTFNINIAGKISFTPSKNGIDSPDHFGFEPLSIKQLKDIEKKDIVIKRSTFSRIATTAVAVILMFLFVSPVGDSVYEPSMQAAFVTSGNTPKSHATTNIQTEENILESRCEIEPFEYHSTEESISTKEIASPGIIKEKADETSETVSATNVITDADTKDVATDISATVTSAVEPVEESTSYSIIVASTPNEQKAQLAIEELSAKSEAAYSVVQGSGRYRIAYSTHNSNQEALGALSLVKEIFPDAWILAH